MCVYRTEDGTNPGAITLKMVPGALLGEFMMRSFGESPSEENVSRLSQILEASPHPKYSLSAKACRGILNRAERRGLELPEALRAALVAQSVSRSEQESPWGKGILIQRERTGAVSTLNNQSVLCLNDQGGSVMHVTHDVSGCIRAQEHGHQPIVVGFKHKQGAAAGGIGYREELAPTLNAEQTSAVYDARGNGDGNIACNSTGDHESRVTDYTAIVATMQGFGDYKESEVASGCKARDYKDATDLIVSVDCRNGYENAELSGTLQAKENGGNSLNYINPVRCANLVRRLTPLECERLQGYPDGWTDIGEWVDSKGKKHKEADSPRYKALGNSIALPFWCWLAKRISAQYERDITIGSLFDGIGGFPYAFEKCGGKAVWGSEIEEFPIAVTKIRFPE